MASYYHLDELLEKYGLMLEHDSCRGTHLFVTGGGPDGGADAPTAQVLAYMEELEQRPDLPDQEWILERLRHEQAMEGGWYLNRVGDAAARNDNPEAPEVRDVQPSFPSPKSDVSH